MDNNTLAHKMELQISYSVHLNTGDKWIRFDATFNILPGILIIFIDWGAKAVLMTQKDFPNLVKMVKSDAQEIVIS